MSTHVTLSVWAGGSQVLCAQVNWPSDIPIPVGDSNDTVCMGADQKEWFGVQQRIFYPAKGPVSRVLLTLVAEPDHMRRDHVKKLLEESFSVNRYIT